MTYAIVGGKNPDEPLVHGIGFELEKPTVLTLFQVFLNAQFTLVCHGGITSFQLEHFAFTLDQ